MKKSKNNRLPEDRSLWIRKWDWDVTVGSGRGYSHQLFSIDGVVLAELECQDGGYRPCVYSRPNRRGFSGPFLPIKWLAVFLINRHVRKLGYRQVPEKYWSML